jgi:hypothetical protein
MKEYCPYCKHYEKCTSEYKEESGYCDDYKPREQKERPE